jgi:hypothetical protein
MPFEEADKTPKHFPQPVQLEEVSYVLALLLRLGASVVPKLGMG